MHSPRYLRPFVRDPAAPAPAPAAAAAAAAALSSPLPAAQSRNSSAPSNKRCTSILAGDTKVKPACCAAGCGSVHDAAAEPFSAAKRSTACITSIRGSEALVVHAPRHCERAASSATRAWSAGKSSRRSRTLTRLSAAPKEARPALQEAEPQDKVRKLVEHVKCSVAAESGHCLGARPRAVGQAHVRDAAAQVLEHVREGGGRAVDAIDAVGGRREGSAPAAAAAAIVVVVARAEQQLEEAAAHAQQRRARGLEARAADAQLHEGRVRRRHPPRASRRDHDEGDGQRRSLVRR